MCEGLDMFNIDWERIEIIADIHSRYNIAILNLNINNLPNKTINKYNQLQYFLLALLIIAIVNIFKSQTLEKKIVQK